MAGGLIVRAIREMTLGDGQPVGEVGADCAELRRISGGRKAQTQLELGAGIMHRVERIDTQPFATETRTPRSMPGDRALIAGGDQAEAGLAVHLNRLAAPKGRLRVPAEKPGEDRAVGQHDHLHLREEPGISLGREGPARRRVGDQLVVQMGQHDQAVRAEGPDHLAGHGSLPRDVVKRVGADHVREGAVPEGQPLIGITAHELPAGVDEGLGEEEAAEGPIDGHDGAQPEPGGGGVRQVPGAAADVQDGAARLHQTRRGQAGEEGRVGEPEGEVIRSVRIQLAHDAGERPALNASVERTAHPPGSQGAADPPPAGKPRGDALEQAEPRRHHRELLHHQTRKRIIGSPALDETDERSRVSVSPEDWDAGHDGKPMALAGQHARPRDPIVTDPGGKGER